MVSGIISNLEMIDWLMFWAMLAMHVGFSRVAAHRLLFVRIRLQRRRPQFDSWVGKIRWRRDRLPTLVFLGFPGGSVGKESACNVGDLGSITGLGRFPGEGKGYPLQCSGLENSMDCIVHGVAKSPTTERLSLPPSPFHVIWCLLSHVGSHIPHGGRLNCGPQRYPHPKGRCGTHI